MASVEPQVTVTSVSGSASMPLYAFARRATASRRAGTPHVTEYWLWSASIAAREPRVLAAVALHPNEAPVLQEQGLLDEHLAGIERLAALPRVRAIGETGLDFFRTGEDGRDAQVRSFEEHIRIAKETGIALQIHDRDAHREVMETLRRVGAPERTVFHCFSGDAEMARMCAEEGWYLSFAGTLTFKSAGGLREALAAVPLEQVQVETDAPYLTPVPHRGRPNASHLLPHTVRAVAAVLGRDTREVADVLTMTASSLYGSWDDPDHAGAAPGE